MKNPIITLEPWEYETAYTIGIRRFIANWGVADAKHYERDAMEEDRNALPASAICEVAVAKYLCRYWVGGAWHRSEHSKYRKLPDVGRSIEVRRVRTGDGVPVRRTDEGKIVWGARMADAEYRSVELLGFVNADEFIPSIPDGEDWWRCSFASLTKPWSEQKTTRPDSLDPAAATGHR